MSSQSTTPFFGRAWALTITPNSGPSANTPIVISSNAFEPEALKITFDINQLAFSSMWHAEFTIYNANGPITSGPSKGLNLYQSIIQEGDIVTFAAGYQFDYPDPQIPPAIWTGPIFFTIQDRLDVVDQRLIIHCLINRALTTQNFLNATLPARATQFTQARFIANESLNKINLNESQVQQAIDSANPQRGAANLPRGKSYFGNPHRYLNALAEQNGMLNWFDSRGWNLVNLQSPISNFITTYAPVQEYGNTPQVIGGVKLTLIGQPQQTQLGVNFRVLLDPTVQVNVPLAQVAIQPQYIRQAPLSTPAPGTSLPPLPLVNKYVVVGVRFSGDSRGNAWYSDITGCAQISSAIKLLGSSGQTDPTGN